MVIHAPDAIERHDSRDGKELDPEHRNGPSKTITVAHQLHLLRFANLAKSIRRLVDSQIRCPILKFNVPLMSIGTRI